MPALLRRQPTSSAACAADFDGAVHLHAAGRLGDALEAYDRVLSRWPDHAESHHNAGTIRAQRGELDSAIEHFLRAIELKPNYAEAHHSLGIARHMAGGTADAIPSFRRAARIRGDSVAWWIDLGVALADECLYQESLAAYDRALMLDRGNVQALCNRGVALRGMHRLVEAAETTRASLALRPDNVAALVNLGVILRELRDFEGARRALDDALEVAPGNPMVLANLGVLLMQLGQHAEARAIAEQIVTSHPDNAPGWNLLGNIAFEAADWALAERCAREALARSPADRNAPWNIAQITLLRGDFGEGFRQFEARRRLDVFVRHDHDEPEWTGEPLAGRAILVHAEQGFGDAIMFARFLPMLKARGAGRVIFECAPEVASLFRGMQGVDEVVLRDSPLPRFDAFAYLLSLPHLLGTTLETLPAPVPYLSAPERPIGPHILAQGEGVRVGLAWAGNPAQPRDRMRSVPLESLEPILATRGVSFFSLQKGDDAVRQLALPGATNIVNLDPLLKDFSDTAAAIAALDLVITVDTSVAHLAGALGKPVWVLLPHVTCWRYLRDRDDSPWYPTMRLFRQIAPRAWTAPVNAVAAALAKFARAPEGVGLSSTTGEPAKPASPQETLPDGLKRTALSADTALRRPIVIGWPVGLASGWGTYGLHLALALDRSARAEPVLAVAPMLQGASPLAERRVRAMRRVPATARAADAIRLTALGNRFQGASDDVPVPGGRQVGVIFFEDTALDSAAKHRAAAFDVIVAGSTWNSRLLKASGVHGVRLVIQGVDPSLFHPAPRTGVQGDRFLVFSGGKLEFRKGQDIVVEAFRRFHATHPDALLVTAWHNHWPRTMAGIDAAGYVRGVPVVRDGRCDVTSWLVANRLPPDAVLDLGLQPQAAIAQTLREVDVAVFANRCEGGTNLVAMEAMACGVPTILSANTGHLDLIGHDTCFPIERQSAVTVRSPLFDGMSDWGESDPDEVVALLEQTYDDRVEARRRGAEGAKLLATLPWSSQAEALLRQLDV